MKRFVTILFAFLLCLAVIGCNADIDTAPELETTPERTTTPATDELVLYLSQSDETMLRAVEEFKSRYPEVEVHITPFNLAQGYEALQDKLIAEMNMGTGPDLVMLNHTYFSDIGKVLSSGMFYNLDILIDEDETFPWEYLNKGIMDTGVFREERLFIPLSYSMPIYTYTETSKNKAEMEFDTPTTIEEFTEIVEEYTRLYAGDRGRTLLHTRGMKYYHILAGAGYSPIDYQTSSYDITCEEFQKMMTFMKALAQKDFLEAELGANQDMEDLSNGRALFAYSIPMTTTGAAILPIIELSLISDVTIFAMPSFTGKPIATPYWDNMAIPRAAKNKLNAYRLIRILLEERYQTLKAFNAGGIPVYQKNLYAQLEAEVKNIYVKSLGRTEYYDVRLEEVGMPLVDDFYELLTDVDGVIPWFFSDSIHIKFWEFLDPYLRDERTYEECIEAFDDFLKIYAAE